MKKKFKINLFAFLLISTKLFSQNDITFDRPGITDLFNTVKRKKIQLEFGYDYFNQLNEQSKFPSLTSRFGLNNTTELRFVFDHGFYSHSMIENFEKQNLNVLSIGLKKNIFNSNNLSTSIIFNFKGGKSPFIKKKYTGFDFIIILQKKFKEIEFINNTGYLFENFNIKNRVFIGNCISYNLNQKNAIFIEDYIFILNQNTLEHGNIIGYTFQPINKIQFDLSCGSIKNFNKNYFFSLGFSCFL